MPAEQQEAEWPALDFVSVFVLANDPPDAQGKEPRLLTLIAAPLVIREPGRGFLPVERLNYEDEVEKICHVISETKARLHFALEFAREETLQATLEEGWVHPCRCSFSHPHSTHTHATSTSLSFNTHTHTHSHTHTLTHTLTLTLTLTHTHTHTPSSSSPHWLSCYPLRSPPPPPTPMHTLSRHLLAPPSRQHIT